MKMAEIILLILKASIVLSVFAIGLKSTFEDTTYLFRRPAQLISAVVSMNVVMPLLAVILGLVLDLNPALRIALIAISVSPVPPIFPNKAFKAGGTETYTIGLLTAAAIFSVILIPIAMEIVVRISSAPLTVKPIAVFTTVLTTVLVPLLIGIGVRTLFPAFAERVAKPLAIVSLVLLIVSALPVLIGMAGAMYALIGDGTVLVLNVFAVIGLIAGHMLGGGRQSGNRHTLALATATRHPAVALTIGNANFPQQRIPLVMMYLIIAGIWSAVYLAWAKRYEEAHAAETNHAVKV